MALSFGLASYACDGQPTTSSFTCPTYGGRISGLRLSREDRRRHALWWPEPYFPPQGQQVALIDRHQVVGHTHLRWRVGVLVRVWRNPVSGNSCSTVAERRIPFTSVPASPGSRCCAVSDSGKPGGTLRAAICEVISSKAFLQQAREVASGDVSQVTSAASRVTVSSTARKTVSRWSALGRSPPESRLSSHPVCAA